jgi:transposase-like protein
MSQKTLTKLDQNMHPELEAEMDDRLDYAHGGRAGKDTANERNGKRAKTAAGAARPGWGDGA